MSNKPFINPSDHRATGSVWPLGQDRDQSVEKSANKGKSIGKSKDRKKNLNASSAAGKPGDLASDMLATGYNIALNQFKYLSEL